VYKKKMDKVDKLCNIDQIDILRSLGLDRYISLPQLLVCGDQSAGKSTLLEKLTGIEFPSSSGMCTTFITEIIMSDGDVESYVVEYPTVQIEKQNYANLSADVQKQVELVEALIGKQEPLNSISDVKSRIEAFKSLTGGRIVSEGVLRVYIKKPKSARLTILDTPGYIHSTINGQSKDLPTKISAMIEEYISKSKTINIAVLPANRDLATNVVMSKVEQYDPQGARTIGVISKIDICSEEEFEGCVKLLHGELKPLELGYHAVSGNDIIPMKWTKATAKENLGIDCLREKLADILASHIARELPKIRYDIDIDLASSKNDLLKLGPDLDSNAEKLRQLINTSKKAKEIWIQCLEGGFVNNPKNLRAQLHKIQQSLQNTIKEMVDAEKFDQTKMKEFLEERRGPGPAGFIDYNTFSLLVYENVKSWEEQIQISVLNWSNTYEDCLKELLKNEICPLFFEMAEYTCKNVISLIKEEMREMVHELIKDESRPHTLDDHFNTAEDNLRRISESAFNVMALGIPKAATHFSGYDIHERLNSSTTPVVSNEVRAVTAMICKCTAYEKTAFKRIIDAVCQNIMERMLVRKGVDRIFDEIEKMDVSLFRESIKAKNKRNNLKKKIEVFENSIIKINEMYSRTS
ncbi:hypothetical protein HDU92_008435, partial [Lobulomyces angularis]